MHVNKRINVNEHRHSLLIFEFFKDNLSETIRYIGLKFSQITKIVMLFRYSEFILIT